jgi:hypothetical protein
MSWEGKPGMLRAIIINYQFSIINCVIRFIGSGSSIRQSGFMGEAR